MSTTQSAHEKHGSWGLPVSPLSCAWASALHSSTPGSGRPPRLAVRPPPPLPLSSLASRLREGGKRTMPSENEVDRAESAVRHAPRRRLRSLAGMHLHAISSLLEPYPFNRGGARVAYFLLLYDSFVPISRITSLSFYYHNYLSDESIVPIQCFMQLIQKTVTSTISIKAFVKVLRLRYFI